MLQQRQKVQLKQSSSGLMRFQDINLQTGAASSDIVAKRREMFLSANERTMQGVNSKDIVYQNGSKLIPRNVLIMKPLQSRSITYPQIFMPDQQLYISLKGNFYTIRDTRNKQKFIQRNSLPLSQTVYFNVEKRDNRLVMVSVEVFQGGQQAWYHVDLVLWDVERDILERRWAVERGLKGGEMVKSMSNKQPRSLSTLTQQQQQTQSPSRNQFQSTEFNQQFKCIQLLDNFKKALLILDTTYTNPSNQPSLKQQLPHKYQILHIQFTHTKNPSHHLPTPSMLLKTIDTHSKVTGRVVIQRLLRQSMVKLINSDYGDIVLLVTSEDIYQLQISSKGMVKQQYSITLKPLGVPKMLMQNKNTYTSNNNIAHLKQSLSQQQLIIDARYFPNSLKVLILTTHGRVMVIESQQCIFTESLYELLSPKDILQSYNIQYFLFNSLHFLNGLLIVSVQAQRAEQCNLLKKVVYQQSILDKLDQRKQAIDYVSRGVVVAKVQSNALSFNKFIPLPFDVKTHTYIKIHTSQEIDEMLIQTINLKTPSLLQCYKCQVLSNRNTFMPFLAQHFLVENKAQHKSIKLKDGLTIVDVGSESARFTFGRAQKVFYMVKNHRVWCYRIYSQQLMMNVQSGIKKSFLTSFFQKPIKLLTNPLTGTVIILFREFIKIFSNIYQSLELLHTINIRQVRDVIFSRYGESMFLAMSDNTIYMLDSYTFRETKVMDFSGEIKNISYPNEYLFCVKSAKDVLTLYSKNFQPRYDQKSDSRLFYDKLYEIKLQSGDVYCVDETSTVVLKKSGFVEIYSHIPEPRPRSDSSDDNQQLRYQLLKDAHQHLVNRKPLGLQKSDQPSYLFYSSQFMTLFVGTRCGHIHQYLMPFMPIDDPSPPQCYNYQVSNSPIIHIQISGNFESLVVGSQRGQIFELGFQQYLNGLRKNGVYVVSKSQNNISQGMIKYEYANRSYLMDNLSTINNKVSQSIDQSYQQCALIDEKLKIDIEDILARIKSQSTSQIQKIYQSKRQTQSQFKTQFHNMTVQVKRQSKLIFEKLAEMREHNQKIKQEMVEGYERQLLGIYRESDRLRGIKRQKMEEFTKGIYDIKEELKKMREQQEMLKQVELQRLQQSCKQLQQQYSQYSIVASQQLSQNTTDLQLFKQQQILRYTQKLQLQQSKKQSYLSQLTRTQKQIQRYKKRSIEFQNLIVQTTNQIQQLSYDINIYSQKKSTLSKQLYEKSSAIELKQAEIVQQIKKTTQLKKVKNVHEFQLQQFQSQITPVEKKIEELEEKVQRMNHQIMVQFNSKVEQNKVIEDSDRKIKELKFKNKEVRESALHTRTKILRFTQSLADILSADPFAANIRRRLSQVIDTFSDTQTLQLTPNQDIQSQKKQSEHMIRKKNMLLKSIQRQEKIQQGVIKNKNQYFRFYSDNTNLVKEYNQLFKENKVLIQEKNQLEKKLNVLKEQLQHRMTPVKRATSLQTIKKVSAIKLTPFQRYENEQMQLTNLKLKGTTETRITRGQNSSSFLKSLIKDVSIVESKYQKNNRVRDRIRTFVNQQPQRQKQIQKQLFQRQKGKSTHIPILKL